MSHQWFKTTYKEEVPCGSSCFEEDRTLYVHHNHSCDIVSFYDQDGDYLFSYQDTVKNNLKDAIERLDFPYKEKWFEELQDGVSLLDAKDRELFNK